MKLESLAIPKTDPLNNFSEEERKVVNDRLQILSTLCFHIGRDFDMKVEVNEVGGGWHWNFKDNIVKADAKDLLEKPMDYLRFVMSHEAGHRRISRVINVIPDEVWGQAGFSFMSNAIEDPRDNNFVADNISKFKDEMKVAYELDETFESEMKEKAKEKVGKTPRFMQAGFEYIKMWFAHTQGIKREIDKELPQDVREVLEKTLEASSRSWNTYPTKDEADNGLILNGKSLSGEETIIEYARESYKINLNEIWPEFKKLVDKDIEEEKKRQQNESKKEGKEMSENEAKEIAEKVIKEIEKELNDKLSGESQKEDEKSKKEKSEDEASKASKFEAFEEDAKKREEETKKQQDEISKILHFSPRLAAGFLVGEYENPRFS